LWKAIIGKAVITNDKKNMALDLYTRQGQGSVLSTGQVDDNFKRIKAAVDVLQAATSGGIGTVTSVTANVPSGLLVNVTNGSTTPDIVITTNLNGFLKGTGTGFVAQAAISLANTETTGILPVSKGGTGVNGSAFVSNRIIEWNGTSFVTGAASTSEITFLQGVTSNIQTQLNGKENSFSILPVNKGGTGLGSSPSNGVLLIGNGTNYVQSTLTAGTGIQVTNGSGSISIENSAPSKWSQIGDSIGYIKTASTNAGVGTIVQNTLSDTLAVAFGLYSNADNSDSVIISSSGVGGGTMGGVGSTTNSPFAFFTNYTERAYFTNGGNFVVRGDNDDNFIGTPSSKINIFANDIGTADNIQNLFSFIAPNRVAAAETGASFDFIGTDNTGVRHGLARIAGVDKGSFKGDLVFYADNGTQDLSYTERFRILSEGAYIPSKSTGFGSVSVAQKVAGLTTFNTNLNKYVYLSQDDGISESIDSCIYTQTVTKTVQNTANSGELIIDPVYLPENFLKVGKSLVIELDGFINTLNNSQNFRISVVLITKDSMPTPYILYDSTAKTIDPSSDASFHSRYVITCRTTGATGTLFSQGIFSYAKSNKDFHQLSNAETTTRPIDTTIDYDLVVVATWSTADVDNYIKCTNAIVKISN
jgi:hypothetical protein